MRFCNAEWRRVADNGGRFLDAWGNAAEFDWPPGDLFDEPRDAKPGGLVLFIGGEAVEAFGPEHARLSDTTSNAMFSALSNLWAQLCGDR